MISALIQLKVQTVMESFGLEKKGSSMCNLTFFPSHFLTLNKQQGQDNE
ncbi:hypothetical protein HII17_03365 [Thalassotalea sp. M1531]|uniref:Uncharacterized protein n=1 Tax=Thalassotalea algicola TaxID=2716224 RepID=A0A7Y0Q5X9_9GAMM|nr:hypothetical protein [Thalassotalea algicola]NMP30591.1 hypothetical protein [Thalassotalea algicola]